MLCLQIALSAYSCIKLITMLFKTPASPYAGNNRIDFVGEGGPDRKRGAETEAEEYGTLNCYTKLWKHLMKNN